MPRTVSICARPRMPARSWARSAFEPGFFSQKKTWWTSFGVGLVMGVGWINSRRRGRFAPAALEFDAAGALGVGLEHEQPVFTDHQHVPALGHAAEVPVGPAGHRLAGRPLDRPAGLGLQLA